MWTPTILTHVSPPRLRSKLTSHPLQGHRQFVPRGVAPLRVHGGQAHFLRLAGSSRQGKDSRHLNGQRCSSLRRRTSKSVFATQLCLGSRSLQRSCPACERRSAADEEDQPKKHQLRAETARPAASYLIQLSNSQKQESVLVTTAECRSVFPVVRQAHRVQKVELMRA